MKSTYNNGSSTHRIYQSGIISHRDNLKTNTANPNHFSQNSWINAGTGTSYGTTAAQSNSGRSNRQDLFLSDKYHLKKEYNTDLSISC